MNGEDEAPSSQPRKTAFRHIGGEIRWGVILTGIITAVGITVGVSVVMGAPKAMIEVYKKYQQVGENDDRLKAVEITLAEMSKTLVQMQADRNADRDLIKGLHRIVKNGGDVHETHDVTGG